MNRYAASTTVSSEQSRMEIERTLARYGASHFMYGTSPGRAIIAFQASERHVQFVLPLPARDDPEFTEYQRGSQTWLRSESEAIKRWEQACRQRWRALALVIKAKLEAVEAGITDFESEFLAHTLMPDGQTFGAWALPQLEEVYATGQMPPLLPGLNDVPQLEGPKA